MFSSGPAIGLEVDRTTTTNPASHLTRWRGLYRNPADFPTGKYAFLINHSAQLIGNGSLTLNGDISADPTLIPNVGNYMIGGKSDLTAEAHVFVSHGGPNSSYHLGAFQTGDTKPRLRLRSDRIEFGPGGATEPDVFLQRAAATTLQTEGVIKIRRTTNSGIVINNLSSDVFAIGQNGLYYISAGLQRTGAPVGPSKFFKLLDSFGTEYWFEGRQLT